MFSMSVAMIILTIKNILSVIDTRYIRLDEGKNLKTFQKYCKKQIFDDIEFSYVFGTVADEVNGKVIGITQAEIYSRRERYDMIPDYFCDGSGHMDIQFNAYIDGYDNGKNKIYLVTFSLYDVMQKCGESILNTNGNNSGIIREYSH